MNIFKKLINKAEELDNAMEAIKEEPASTPEPEEEWIWVEGYKATEKDMKCRDYQYELGKQYDMPDGQKIEVCESGFHLCLSLADVYDYYDIGYGHRFFIVKALVRKSDIEKYCSSNYVMHNGEKYYFVGDARNKLTSKSIIFLSELTSDEILRDTEIYNLPSQYHPIARNHNINYALQAYQKDTLIKDGYSEAFASHIVSIGKFDIAHAVGSQKDLSMDVKVLTILYEQKEN